MYSRTVTWLFTLVLLVSTSVENSQLAASPTDAQAIPLQGGKVACTVELLTDPEGIDFNSNLRSIYKSVKQRWYANMPPSVEKGQQGLNRVGFQIQRDGNLVKDSLKLFPSGKDDIDAASLQAVRDAAPFDRLPDTFSKPSIKVRFSFFYNLPADR